MSEKNMNHEVLQWKTLAVILDFLIEEYGFDGLAKLVRVNCFAFDPSRQSSLKFLRKTEWARLQVQGLYVRTILEKKEKGEL